MRTLGGHADCRPLTIWSMGRPGTRYPDPDMILKMHTLSGLKDQILRNHDKRRSEYHHYAPGSSLQAPGSTTKLSFQNADSLVEYFKKFSDGRLFNGLRFPFDTP